MLTLLRQKTGVEGPLQHESSTTANHNQLAIDEYLRKRLMPVEGAIPAACNALLEFAVRKDDSLLQTGEGDQIDDKTAFIIKKD